MTIWKYILKVTDKQDLEMPRHAVILSVDNQGGALCLWAEVNEAADTETRSFMVCGTGNPIRENEARTFIGTVLMGFLVWHVYEVS